MTTKSAVVRYLYIGGLSSFCAILSASPAENYLPCQSIYHAIAQTVAQQSSADREVYYYLEIRGSSFLLTEGFKKNLQVLPVTESPAIIMYADFGLLGSKGLCMTKLNELLKNNQITAEDAMKSINPALVLIAAEYRNTEDKPIVTDLTANLQETLGSLTKPKRIT